MSAHMLYIMLSMEALNACHPFCTLDKWIEQARDLGETPRVKDYYEMNARRLVTTWGGDLNDYSCRNWAGLISNYYAMRWSIYIDYLNISLINGSEYNNAKLKEDINAFQQAWPTSKGLHKPFSEGNQPNVMALCREINKEFRKKFETMKAAI